eukprot:CAMPEP_0196161166 /NCGR_PEP_ID=MMETSP0910-20130528/47196_1 /TAXON_ID=49265 /ORGANISM="Thalassiosira rotula, Strain GSO102" /LENGTH=292 /DNA_ID=CAMNT_0041426107 /DNA_START=602 /DNA_END=1480 /DNA_ORIENTATION=+
MWQYYSSITPDVNVLVYNSSSLCTKGGGGASTQANCTGYNNIHMSPYWMKVLAVLNAMYNNNNEDDLIVFMDTDMQILNANFARSILELEEIQSFLNSNKSMLVIDERDFSFWDGETRGKRVYKAPIVSNMFAVINNDIGRRMMHTWWQSVTHHTKMDNNTFTSIKSMLWQWPWEQERLTAYYDAKSELFYAVEQSWSYMGWVHHGPLCCVGFNAKHDIVRSLNETLGNQTETLWMREKSSSSPSSSRRWMNASSYEEMVSDLYGQIDIRPLRREVGQLSPRLASFWNGTGE